MRKKRDEILPTLERYVAVDRLFLFGEATFSEPGKSMKEAKKSGESCE